MRKLTRLMLGLPLAATCLLAAPAAARAMDIVLKFNTSGTASVSNWGAQTNSMTSAIEYVAQEYDSLFTDNITLGITVNGETGSGISGASTCFTTGTYSYTQIYNALSAKATNPAQQIAIANLPMTDPSPDGGPYNVPVAEAAALGLLSQSSSYAVGAIAFPADSQWNLNPNNRAISGEFDFFGFVEHEMSEVLGRTWGLGNGNQGNGSYVPYDLFRYDGGTTTRDMTNNTNVWFSINGGNTDLLKYNYKNPSAGNHEDPSDWGDAANDENSGPTNDAFNGYSAPNVENAISATDLLVMNVMGYHLSSAAMNGGTWAGNASGSWTTPSYWTYPIVPTGGTTTVYFAGVPIDPSAPITVTLDGNQSAGELVFNVGNSSGYTLAQGSGGTLSLGTASGASITVVAGSHAITAPITLEGPLAVNVSASSALQLSGPIGEANASSFTFNGPGLLNYSAVGRFTASTNVNGGTLQVTGGLLPATVEYISGVSMPVAVLSSGVNSVSSALYVGNGAGESGTYIIQGGNLSSAAETIGGLGTGSVTQSGGTNSAPGGVSISNSGAGTYTMTGGLLTTSELEIGFSGPSGGGTFLQTSGTVQASGGSAPGLVLDSDPGYPVATYSLSGGQLTANSEYVGYYGTGSFMQFGGTHHVTSGLTVGGQTNLSSGSYSLQGGLLSTGAETIGNNSTGGFLQSGGTNSDAANLYLGYGTAASGSYNLQGGRLSCSGSEFVGYSGTGSFTQSGGTSNTGPLYVGYKSGSFGTYSLGSGSLYADDSNGNYLGYYGTGSFTQSGGNNYMSTLALGYGTGSSGTYLMSSGSLVDAAEVVGWSGSGNFTQSGGYHMVLSSLALGNASSGSGTYFLSGNASLWTEDEYIGYSGSGSFWQSGGTNAPYYYLYVGLGNSSVGSYCLSGSGMISEPAYGEYIGQNSSFWQTGGTNSAGTLYLTGGSLGGTYNLNGGLLSLYSLSQGPGATFNFGGGTFQAQYSFATSVPITLTGSGSNGVFDTNGNALTLNGALSGPGGLTVDGGGTLTLGTSDSYTGRTLVRSGTLLLADSNALSGSTFDTSGSGGLSFAGRIGGFAFGGLHASGNLLLTDLSGADIALTVGGNNADTTFSGSLSDSSGSGSLTKTGTGTLVLSGTNTYGGGTFVEGGTLVVTNNEGLPDGSSLTVGDPSAFGTAVPAEIAAQPPVPVPEPGTLTLLAIGTGLSMASLVRRRTRDEKRRLPSRSKPGR